MNLEIKNKLQSLLTAANAKTGESDTTLTDAIQSLVDGYGQGGDGNYAKKTGTFTLESNYTYSNSAAGAYTGSILIDTGLLRIDALIVWSEEWEDDTEAANCFGLSLGFNNDIPVNDEYAASPYQQYSGMSFMRNKAQYKYYGSVLQGIIFHNATNGVPEGKFGLRCHSTSFPIIAGHTIHWVAWGVGDQDDLPIVDGIVVKARDSDGYATEIDLYVENGVVPYNLFRSGNTNNATITHGFTKLQKINFKTPVTIIREYAFNWLTALAEIDLDFSSLTRVEGNSFQGCAIPISIRVPNGASFSANAFNGSGIIGFYTEAGVIDNNQCASCTKLKTFEAPKITRFGLYTSSILYRCTALETVLLGGVGYGITSWGTNNFYGCTQTGLTVTAYTDGSHVDGLLANIRNGATNATIIIKASENTTYNGTSYAAGDTILTSTP